MKRVYISVCAILMASCGAAFAQAQPPAKALAAVPRLVNYSGTLTDGGGKALTGVIGVTFALYEEQEGGAPVWMETQNVQADGSGKYTALLGATRNEGIPAEVFGSGQRWLGVQVQGQAEAPRVLMTSVPYSLKAVDAETLGGLPASAFALAGASAGTSAGTSAGPATGTAGNGAFGASIAPGRAVGAADLAKPAATPAAVTGTGTAGTVPLWSTTTALGNSVILQSSGNVGIGRVSANAKFLAENSAGAGVVGASSSSTADTAIGVQGQDLETTGTTTGVIGVVASDAGTGVEGNANATTGATFGVVGNSASSAGYGVAGSVSATTGDTNGVFGQAASDAGTGVWGNATATSGNTIGVSGTNASDSGIGVDGEASAATGGTVGVYGTVASDSGYGVWGISTATSGTTIGVYGQGSSAGGYGVEGQNTASSGTAVGVYGKAVSSTGVGVEGNATATTGETTGVAGIAASDTGMGVSGATTATSGETYGVAGGSLSSVGVGVYGIAIAQSSIGMDFEGTTPSGVWGDTNSGTAGVLATAGDTVAFAGYNNANSQATLYVENQTTAPTAVVLATQGSGGFCDIFTNGNLECSGSVGGHASVNNSREVSMYAMQSPENWYEDLGSGQLHNGAAVVTIEAEYAQTVNTGTEYHVFLTPKGDCKGLYVANETGASFEVHELGGGSSSIAFDYRIVAKRKGFENIRMADAVKIQRGLHVKSGNSRNAAGATRVAALLHPPVATRTAEPVRPAPAAKKPAHAVKSPLAAKPVQGRVVSPAPESR
jgi:hypothetical protein